MSGPLVFDIICADATLEEKTAIRSFLQGQSEDFVSLDIEARFLVAAYVVTVSQLWNEQIVLAEDSVAVLFLVRRTSLGSNRALAGHYFEGLERMLSNRKGSGRTLGAGEFTFPQETGRFIEARCNLETARDSIARVAEGEHIQRSTSLSGLCVLVLGLIAGAAVSLAMSIMLQSG